MSQIIFKSKYSASVWDVTLIDSEKRNIHSFGKLTAFTVFQVTQNFSNTEFRDIVNQRLEETFDAVKINSGLLEQLVSNTGYNTTQLIELAEFSSSDGWPFAYQSTIPNNPTLIKMHQVFAEFDSQSLIIDALLRTGALQLSSVKQLQKKFVKPIRRFLQITSEEIKKKGLNKNISIDDRIA
ncbi:MULTISPECIES: hypothetical protein [unclassified Pseudoalteromonas]|uniref:hypothetical protein n=1 Tax=unclassified Pseudoalteromonas TaxID=194690 RepID=UPI001F2D8242|nr:MULTISPECIES: hypothetical protein [unclassified Pseudoalteromonas]MCF2829727.1 hypothetical protein [Pseudoalteromonas sp. OF5H-5]MCF2834554.1 hypothetical protein [Pseudoalteromonas sp. DL2-H6]MCF2927617.1 hypothetical protein [Pseudoalteromonas sp. DL2-H1]